MKSITKMTRKDFDAVSYIDSLDRANINFDSIVILPQRHRHDSGYRCIDFVACKKDTAICRLSGCSDVLHINGIGGFGYKWSEDGLGVPNKIRPIDWNIDCLPVSGLLRLFLGNSDMILITDGMALSSFCIYAVPK